MEGTKLVSDDWPDKVFIVREGMGIVTTAEESVSARMAMEEEELVEFEKGASGRKRGPI